MYALWPKIVASSSLEIITFGSDPGGKENHAQGHGSHPRDPAGNRDPVASLAFGNQLAATSLSPTKHCATTRLWLVGSSGHQKPCRCQLARSVLGYCQATNATPSLPRRHRRRPSAALAATVIIARKARI